MTFMSASQARENFYRLIDQVSMTHEPTFIKGKRHNAVLISEEDWNSLQETLYLLSIPGMKEDICNDLVSPLKEANEKLEW